MGIINIINGKPTINADGNGVFDVSGKIYTVIFEDWDGTTLKTQTVVEGGQASPPNDPTRAGHTFSLWSGDYTGVTSNVTITATYTINTYTVTFRDWDGSFIYSEDVEYESGVLNPPSDPTRVNYFFHEWSSSYNIIYGTTTIYARYRVDITAVYSIIIDDNTVDYGQVATLTVTKLDNSYPDIDSFSWGTSGLSVLVYNLSNSLGYPATIESTNQLTYDDNGSITCSINTEDGASGALTNLAVTMKRARYVVTFIDHDGSTLKTETVNYGEDATPPSDPTRDYHIFSGWSGTYTNVTSNSTVVATYTVDASSIPCPLRTASVTDVNSKVTYTFENTTDLALEVDDAWITRYEQGNEETLASAHINLSAYGSGSVSWQNTEASNVTVGLKYSVKYNGTTICYTTSQQFELTRTLEPAQEETTTTE